ncbi:pyridoxamine 5'-phosphate oxidase family protein [Methanocrinis sp.]|uniref:pyridoxamine 5'-phosphate oxidase family protein n=1 Tax=Methanocrinis sp. TaxID=3101522 RepID=UPI003D0B0ECB
MTAELMDYFNRQPRIGTLSTSSKEGEVDVAVMGSPRMVDEETVIMALAKNRTFANLQENPRAVYMILEPGEEILDWKGIRVYLRMVRYETSGELIDEIKEQGTKFIGEAAAEMLHAAITLKVEEVRPLVDLGQGWERSI